MNRGRGRGQSMQPVDPLTPILPPLYPTAPTPPPMPENSLINDSVVIQKKMAKYFLANYAVAPIKEKYKSAFVVERYSDRYNSPSSLNLNTAHRPKSSHYPPELFAKDIRLSRKSMKMFSIKRRKRLSTDMEGNEEKDSDEEDGDPKSKLMKKADMTRIGTDEEDDEDIDEEMDVGNDYMVEHFDNGEDFNDNDALDAGGYGDGDDGHFY